MARVVERLRALANDLDPGGVDALKVFWRAPPPKQPSAAAAAEAAALAAALGGDPSPPPAAWLASAGAYAPEVGAGVVATSGARGIDRMEDAHAIATPRSYVPVAFVYRPGSTTPLGRIDAKYFWDTSRQSRPICSKSSLDESVVEK